MDFSAKAFIKGNDSDAFICSRALENLHVTFGGKTGRNAGQISHLFILHSSYMAMVEETYTSLLDTLAFPPFLSCPYEHKASPVYYECAPIRHWCFLGEIERISGVGRLCLDVRDREGNAARIYFYLDRMPPEVLDIQINPPDVTYPRHKNIPRDLVRTGNTIAVLYADQHSWKRESSTGIRIENGDLVKIFPCRLDRLLSLSYRIMRDVQHTYPLETRSCGSCCDRAPSLQRCTGCRFAWYCNSECQRTDWSRHKMDCRLIQGVKLLMKQDWNHFDTFLRFPLTM